MTNSRAGTDPTPTPLHSSTGAFLRGFLRRSYFWLPLLLLDPLDLYERYAYRNIVSIWSGAPERVVVPNGLALLIFLIALIWAATRTHVALVSKEVAANSVRDRRRAEVEAELRRENVALREEISRLEEQLGGRLNRLARYLKRAIAECRFIVERSQGFPNEFLLTVAKDVDDEIIPLLAGAFTQLEVDQFRCVYTTRSDAKRLLSAKANLLEGLVSSVEAGTALIAPEFIMPTVPTSRFLTRCERLYHEALELHSEVSSYTEDEELPTDLRNKVETVLTRAWLDFGTFGMEWTFSGVPTEEFTLLLGASSRLLWDEWSDHRQPGAQNPTDNHLLVLANGLAAFLRRSDSSESVQPPPELGDLPLR